MRPREATSAITDQVISPIAHWEARICALVSRAADQIGATHWVLQKTQERHSLILFSDKAASFVLCSRLTQNEVLLRELKNCPTGNKRIWVFHSTGNINHVTPMLQLAGGEIEFILSSVGQKLAPPAHSTEACNPRKAYLDYTSGPIETTLKTVRLNLDKPCGFHFGVGRYSNQDILLTDPRVSRRHAEIYSGHRGKIKRQQFFIEDVGSLNGTRINRRKLKPNIPRRLKAGDRIRIGDTELTFGLTEALSRKRRKPRNHKRSTVSVLG